MHAGARLGSQWTRRKPCVQGPLRRAHPASGATWNVQVVRGKVTSKCLWHACRALSLGLLLMVLGAAMATIGYYADHLSIGQEIRGNATVRVKNESRGFHLNNLSYAGPIVMGVGGFIVVAACVMTFEARDSAAKVMPARLKGTIVGNQVRQVVAARRCVSSQTGPTRWDHHLGVFRSSPSSADRRALTAAFLQFSKTLADNRITNQSSLSHRPLLAGSLSPAGPKRSILRSGSVPNLESKEHTNVPPLPRIAPRKPVRSGCALLNPAMLPRQALSVDETHVRCSRYSRESLAGSQGSMAMDLHVPNDGPVTLRVRDRSRAVSRNARGCPRPMPTRSDTAKRHMLARQKQIMDDEEHHAQNTDRIRDTHSCSPHLPGCQRTFTQDSFGNTSHEHRRNSNASDTLYSRRTRCKENIPMARSASTSPHPRRTRQKLPPVSLDLGSSYPISENDPCDLSPDLVMSEYHTVCDDQMISITSETKRRSRVFPNSVDSRDSRFSTETGTLHTAEINISEDGMTDFDLQTETPSSHTEIDDGDLTEDITPTFDSDVTNSKNDDNDASTVIDVICAQEINDDVT